MNILLIVPDGKSTIAKVSYNLYKALCKTKEVNVYVVNLNFTSSDTYVFEGAVNVYTKYKQHFKCLKFIYCIFLLIRLKKKQKIDIAISTLNACNSYNVLSKIHERTIGVFHAPYCQTSRLSFFSRILSNMSFRFLYPRLDKICAVSSEVYDSLLGVMGEKIHNKLEVAYNIHDFSEILKLSSEELPVNEEYIFKKKTFLYVGSLSPVKAPDRLIKAFSILNEKKDCNLLFIGDTNNIMYKNQLIALVNKLNLSEKVFFLGFKINPYSYMKKCYCLVLPSKSEGLPGVLIEALILNKCVVSTNSSKGIWEIMGCLTMYKKDLDGIYNAGYGIITSNLNKEFDESPNAVLDVDDYNLAEALKNSFLNPRMVDQIGFFLSEKERFMPHNIINQILKLDWNESTRNE